MKKLLGLMLAAIAAMTLPAWAEVFQQEDAGVVNIGRNAPLYTRGQYQTVTTLLAAATATGAGTAATPTAKERTFQAYCATSAGAGAATIKIQGSNVSSPGTNDWVDLGTITLTLSTTQATDGFVSVAPWYKVQANITALSGTGATCTAVMGIGG